MASKFVLGLAVLISLLGAATLLCTLLRCYFTGFTARIKKDGTQISTLAESIMLSPQCESVHTGNTALSKRCGINRKHCSHRASSNREKSSAQLEFQEDPVGCLSKKPFIICEACTRTLVDVRLACAELRSVRSRTYSP